MITFNEKDQYGTIKKSVEKAKQDQESINEETAKKLTFLGRHIEKDIYQVDKQNLMLTKMEK